MQYDRQADLVEGGETGDTAVEGLGLSAECEGGAGESTEHKARADARARCQTGTV